MRVLQLRLQEPIREVRFNAAGSALAVVAGGRRSKPAVEVVIHSGRQTRLPAARACSVAYSWDGEYVAVGTTDGTACVYRTDDRSAVAELRPGRPGFRVESVSFAPTTDPKWQWLTACGSECWSWNPATQQYLVAPDEEYYGASVFGPSADMLFALSESGVQCYQLRPFQEVWQVPIESLNLFRGLEQTSRLRISDDGLTLAVFTAGALVATLGLKATTPRVKLWRAAWGSDLAFLPNSRLLAVADGSPTLRVYDTDTGTVAREYDWGIGGIHCVTFSNDGAMGAAGGDKGKIVVWDVE